MSGSVDTVDKMAHLGDRHVDTIHGGGQNAVTKQQHNRYVYVVVEYSVYQPQGTGGKRALHFPGWIRLYSFSTSYVSIHGRIA